MPIREEHQHLLPFFSRPLQAFIDLQHHANSVYIEEIDPDFVYALHNFIATVEGQANAAKGDAMVLLDDTNSYWWLVRLVKDSSIGTRRGITVVDPF